ncbi:hypothetical protein RN001_010194 [Aquatica leii]|uniref:Uncharacterized protein n=1 Tax=Aquatica leii TaxID=1421715 RepID=A0AAN7P7K5_9COLE|nr:hypothetical protein RN001_010194 [Aquatica leii]
MVASGYEIDEILGEVFVDGQVFPSQPSQQSPPVPTCGDDMNKSLEMFSDSDCVMLEPHHDNIQGHKGKDLEILKNLYQEEEEDLSANLLDGHSQASEDSETEILKLEDIEKQFMIKFKDAYKDIKIKLNNSDKKNSVAKRQINKLNSAINKLKKQVELYEKQCSLESKKRTMLLLKCADQCMEIFLAKL